MMFFTFTKVATRVEFQKGVENQNAVTEIASEFCKMLTMSILILW